MNSGERKKRYNSAAVPKQNDDRQSAKEQRKSAESAYRHRKNNCLDGSTSLLLAFDGQQLNAVLRGGQQCVEDSIE
jgi:hypothetical protein